MGVLDPLDHDEVADALGRVGELRHRAARRRRRRRQGMLTGGVTVFAALIAVVVAVTASGSPASVSVTGPPHAGSPGRLVPVRKLVAMQMLSPQIGVGLVASSSTVDAASGPSARGVLQLAVTDDGARSWRLSGSPVVSIGKGSGLSPDPALPGGGMIAFTSTTSGYFEDSSGLYHTGNGGHTWTVVPPARYGPPGSKPTSVLASGNRVWVLSCPGPACKHPSIAVTTAGTAHWTHHPTPGMELDGPPAGSTVTVTNTAVTWRSTDSGASWAKLTAPCNGPVVVATPNVVFAGCGLNNFSRTGKLANTATIYRSSDAGRRWQSWATFRQTYTGMGAEPSWAPLAASPQGNILYFTQNIWDGQLRALTPGATALTTPAKVGLVYGIDQLSAQDAWLLAPAQGIWATDNAGHSWNLITTSATTAAGSSGGSGPGLPAGWQKATPQQVRAAWIPQHLARRFSYLATWTVIPIGAHPQTTTVTSGRAADGAWFYRITPASAVAGLLMPHDVAIGGTYAYYFHPGTTNAQVSCTTHPTQPHTWTCASWTNLSIDMSVDSALQGPDPAASAGAAVGNLLAAYGYNQASSGPPTTPAYLAHPHRLGLALTCVRFGSPTHPRCPFCTHDGLVISYQLPQGVPNLDGGVDYSSIRVTSYQPAPPAANLHLPAPLTPPLTPPPPHS